MYKDLGSLEPRAYGKHRLAQIRKRRLRRVQSTEPSAQRRRVGHAIRIFDRRRRGFPTTTLDEIPPQCLTACGQAVMAVRRGERRQEGERLAAPVAQTAANPDPIMMFIMGLFASPTVTHDGILHTNRASA